LRNFTCTGAWYFTTNLLPAIGSYEEKLLLREVGKGNEKAFRTLYDLYVDRISAYIYKLCKSGTATEEIVQEIFIKLWLNRTSMEEIAVPEAYLFSMARNKTIDYLRHLAKESGLISLLSGQLSSINYNDIEDQLDAAALQQLITSALDQLSDQKKKIFRLSKVEGFSHDEIAEAMHLSKSTVKNHLSETLHYLREQISHHPNSEALLLITVIFFSR
jgi:RNA polymerase sigma-70 factor (family 1)